jgi:hypothetical protein
MYAAGAFHFVLSIAQPDKKEKMHAFAGGRAVAQKCAGVKSAAAGRGQADKKGAPDIFRACAAFAGRKISPWPAASCIGIFAVLS